MRALFIEHDHVSEGGPVWRGFRARGFEVVRFLVVPQEKFSTPNQNVVFPNFEEFEVIVVMGAPWGAWDEISIGNWLVPEMQALKSAHEKGIPILGICFGAQVMSRILGGKVERAPHAEVGWHMIESNFPELISDGPWFQYHWDRFTTPTGATELAKSSLCPQAFTISRTLGLQFHPDIDPDVLDLWLAMEGGCAEVENEGLNVEELRMQTRTEQEKSELRTYNLVNYFLDVVANSEIA